MDRGEMYTLPRLNGEELGLIIEALNINALLMRARAKASYIHNDSKLTLSRYAVLSAEIVNKLYAFSTRDARTAPTVEPPPTIMHPLGFHGGTCARHRAMFIAILAGHGIVDGEQWAPRRTLAVGEAARQFSAERFQEWTTTRCIGCDEEVWCVELLHRIAAHQ